MRFLGRLAILTVLAGAALRIDFVVGVGVMMAVVLVSVRWIPALVARRLEVTREAPRRVMWGETIDLTVTARNLGWLPASWVSVVDPVPFDLGTVTTRWVTSLRRYTTKTMERALRARRRGLYRLGPGVVATGDVFGLRRVRAADIPAAVTVVYPKIVAVGKMRLPASGPNAVLAVPMALVDDPTRTVGVRDYVAGDPLRRVHWTASARMGRIQVKEFQPGIERTTVICLDLSRGSFPMASRRTGSELAVTAAASLCFHVVTVERLPVGLRVTGWDPSVGADIEQRIPARSDPAGLVPILESLARVRPAREARLGGLLDPSELGFGTTVVFITGTLDEDRVVALARLRRSGARPSVLEIVPPGGESRWSAALHRFQIPVRAVYREADLAW